MQSQSNHPQSDSPRLLNSFKNSILTYCWVQENCNRDKICKMHLQLCVSFYTASLWKKIFCNEMCQNTEQKISHDSRYFLLVLYQGNWCCQNLSSPDGKNSNSNGWVATMHSSDRKNKTISVFFHLLILFVPLEVSGKMISPDIYRLGFSAY